MAMQSKKTITFENSKGPISHLQSQKIIAKLKKNGDDTHIFDQHLAVISSIVDSPIMLGNEVNLLIDGPVTYGEMLASIDQATDHINMETYIFEDDVIGQQFAVKLIEKQKNGVQVNLIYDSVGSIYTPKEFFETMKESGVNVLEYNPINPLNTVKGWNVNQRDHRKLLIIDGKVAFVGGINISSVYSSGSFSSTHKKSKRSKDAMPWRDTHLKVSGLVVSEFQKLFIETWTNQHGEPLKDKLYYPPLTNQGHDIVIAVGSTPDEAYSQIFATIISAINSAKTHIKITNAYFVPDPQLLAALKNAAKRGVEVKILLPQITDSKIVFYASHSYYDELLSAHVRIYELQIALLHAKTALIDGVWSTVGSTNLDWRSFVNNQEINAVVLGQGFGDQMQYLFDHDLDNAKEIMLKDWRSRPMSARIKEQAARLWARFL
jgi:cardiolipin synthase